MDFTTILLVGSIIGFIDLVIIYSFSNVFFKLQFINKVPKVTIKTKYFFLPLTTKIREYSDLKEAYVRSVTSKHTTTYNIELEFKNSWRREVVFSEKNYQKISKYCDEINYALKNSQDYSISENDPPNVAAAVILVLVVSLPILFLPMIKGGGPFIEKLYCFIVAMLILSICFGLSSIVNNSKKKKQTMYYNNKENVDIDSEADRINDSIIK